MRVTWHRAEVKSERARTRFIDDGQRDRLRVRKQTRAGQLRAGVPGRDEECEREEPGAHVHSPPGGR